MSRQRFAPVPVLLLACLAGACDHDVESNATDATRDSVAVRTVEIPQDAWSTVAEWRLESEPVLAIGVIEGAPEYELSDVAGALRLDDGRIVIADGASRQIRFFDANGLHQRSVGREGGGPGEYSHLTWIARFGADSLLVWDGFQARGSVLARDGTFGRSIPAPHLDRSAPSMVGVFGDRSLLWQVSAAVPRNRDIRGKKRLNATYFRYGPAGHIDTIASLPSSELYFEPGKVVYHMPFTQAAVIAVTAESFHYGFADTYEISTYSAEGRLTRVVRSPRSSPVTRQDRDAVMDRARTPEEERRYGAMSWPEAWPAYDAFQVDAEGNLWVGEYLRPDQERRGWSIHGPDGDLIGKFVAPPHFTIYDIGSDYLLGKAAGELNVNHVILYRLVKPEAE